MTEYARVLNVTPSGILPPELAGCALEVPQRGTLFHNLKLHVAGWLAFNQPLNGRLIATCGREFTAEVPVGGPRPDVSSTFRNEQDVDLTSAVGFDHVLLLDSHTLQGQSEAVLSLAYDTPVGRVKLSDVTFTVARTTYHREPHLLRPLLVTSLGRCGTTLMLRALGEHPGVAIVPIYPYEAAVASHVAEAARSALDRRTLGVLPTDTAEFLVGEYSLHTRNHFVHMLEAFYRSVAQQHGRTSAMYFAEKSLPGTSQDILDELYGGALKEIFLVRDFRDMVCSVLAFNAKRGLQDFSRQFFSSDEDYIYGVGSSVRQLLSEWHERRDRGLLVRYEDLVAGQAATLKRIFSYLELDADDETVDRIVQACTPSQGDEISHHITSSSVEASTGRWRVDLSPHLVRVAEQSFGEALDELGYGRSSWPVDAPRMQEQEQDPSRPESFPAGPAWPAQPRYGDGRAGIVAFKVCDEAGTEIEEAQSGRICRFQVAVNALGPLACPDVRVRIFTAEGVSVASLSSWAAGVQVGARRKGEGFVLEFTQSLPLGPGVYRLSVGVGDVRGDTYEPCDHRPQAFRLTLLPAGYGTGLVDLRPTVRVLDGTGT